MRVKIISDSTCDLSPALLERYDIAVTPLCVIKDGKDFHDGVDITPADIFAHVDGGGDLCSTSAVSQYEYGEMFARYANEYDAVVQITIGANFSCCYQNAKLAAADFDNGCGRAGRESSAPEALHRGAKRQDGRVQEVPRLV